MPDRSQSDTGQLVAFLQGRDAPCPRCGYNLRNLTDDTCPECGDGLCLTVGVQHVRFGWFLATVAPSLFSGIAAVLMLSVILAALLTGAGPLPPAGFVVDLFGFASGTAAVLLIVRRHQFIRLPLRTQRICTGVAWGIHTLPFLGLLVLFILTA